MSKKDKGNEPDIHVDLAAQMLLNPEKLGMSREEARKNLRAAWPKLQEMAQGKPVGYCIVRVKIYRYDSGDVSFGSQVPVIDTDPDTNRRELPVFTAPELAERFMEDLTTNSTDKPNSVEALVVVEVTMQQIEKWARENRRLMNHIRVYGKSGYSSLNAWPSGQFVERTPIEWASQNP